MRLRRKSPGKKRNRFRLGTVENLEPRIVLDGRMLITEFAASNGDAIEDEDGDSSDWIELMNVGDAPVNLDGWHLTDDPEDLNKWEFPAVEVAPGKYQLVFASDKDRDDPSGNLHTNFKLSSQGEYLALTQPDESIAYEYAPSYPAQIEDVSYGIPSEIVEVPLVMPGAAAQLHVPTSDALDPNLANDEIEGSWVDPALDTNNAQWTDKTVGVGYWDESMDPNPQPGDGILLADSVSEFSSSQGQNNWRYGYWNETTDDEYDPDSSDFRQFLKVPVAFLNNWNADEMQWDLTVRTSNKLETTMSSEWEHPAGLNTGKEAHQTIHRWQSEVTGGLLIHGSFNNPDPSGDGVTARILVAGEEVFSTEFNGTSVDFSMIRQVKEGDKIDFLVGTGDAKNNVGDRTALKATIEDVTEFVGDQDGVPTLTPAIKSDIESDIKGVSSSAYLRIPFIPETTDFDALTLEIQYQDAFVAYINGEVVASSNGPLAANSAWNSVASSERTVSEALEFESFSASVAIDILDAGVENILSIHGINASINDDDMLITPRLIATKLQVEEAGIRYFASPTPGADNGLGAETIGAIFTDRSHSPNEPQASDPIVVTAEVTETFESVSSVTLNYRVMYGSTSQLPMVDDGSGNDAVAGDGIYTATIPAGIGQPGEMVRWFMTAKDAAGTDSRYPLHEIENDSEEYFGAVYFDADLLPENPDLVTFQTFFEFPNRKNNDSGTYGSVYYDGEFYDNVRFDRHGQSSGGFPKKSFDVNFPKDHRFRLKGVEPRYKKFNLLSNYADKAKMRNPLAWHTRDLTGTPSALSFPVLMHENGEFYSLADFVEDADDRFLERIGHDTNNPVYKIYNTFNTASGAEKKTAKDVPGNEDLDSFIQGLNSNSGTALRNYIYDNVDLAGMANYLAGFTLTSNTDCCHKNFYAYRDQSGSGDWQFIPWDVDLSYGRKWGGFGLSYHDYTIYATNPLKVGSNNNLIAKLYAIDEFEEMYYRRVRTIMDEFFGAPDADNTLIEDYIQYLKDLIGPYGQDDLDKFGQVSSNHQAQPFETWEVAVNKILDQYMGPRRDYLYNTLAAPDPDPNAQDPVLVFEGGNVSSKYFVPNNNSLGTTWTSRTFNDSDWTTGQFGYGFETSGSDFQDAIETDVNPNGVHAGATTLMTRTEFDLTDVADINQLTLNVKYDDGFVAYINGTEVTRANVAGAVTWDARASSHPDSAAKNFVPFVFDTDGLTLYETGNVLSVQIVNASPTSSDMLLDIELYTGEVQATSSAPIPAGQRDTAKVEVASVDFNPLSGNQDEEYIELTNTGNTAVDISGWTISNAVDMTFRPGTVITAGGSLYVTPDSQSFRARTEGPSGGQGLFVQEGYDGHLSNFGETIDIHRRDGSLASTYTYEGSASDVQRGLRISEIMYHPLGPDTTEQSLIADSEADDFEYVELMNVGTSELDLTDVKFTRGITFDFTNSNVTSLGAGERVVVVRDLASFETRYGDVENSRIAGAFTGSLSNSGEAIKIEDASSSTVQEFSYNDSVDGGWSERADGHGSSLQVVDTAGDYNASTNWEPSAEIGGSPAADGRAALHGLAINEFLTDSNLATRDQIEIVNTSNNAIDLGDYFLSDSADSVETLTTFALPATTLAPGAYVTFVEADLGFRLSRLGDEIYLTYAGGESQQDATMFADFVAFGDIAPGETYGRSPNATGPFVPLLSPTWSGENSAPRVGPVIISELQYNPGEPTEADLAIDPSMEENDLEFVEIHNTGAAVTLTDWRVRGGIDIDFDEGETLAAGETVVVVSFNPDNPDNGSRVDAFRGHYGIGDDVRLLGGYGGRLDDGGERVTLQRPGEPLVVDPDTIIPRYLEDEVRYSDSAPWAASADGTGASLTRINENGLGNESTSWFGATPTPGRVEFGNLPGDLTMDGLVDDADIDALLNAIRAGSDDAKFDLDGSGDVSDADVTYLVERVLGTFLGDANLDGVVNVRDLNVIGVGWQSNVSGWAQGDFDGNGSVDASDLNDVGVNWQKGVAARASLAALPLPSEPESGLQDRLAQSDPHSLVRDDAASEDLASSPRRRALRSRLARRSGRIGGHDANSELVDFSTLADEALANWESV